MSMRKASRPAVAIALLGSVVLGAQTREHSVGRAPTAEEIRALGVTVAPDGKGLPEGSGDAVQGRALFAERCARCHGPKADGDIGPPLVGGQGTLATKTPKKTVGSFWPYAPVVWNYIHRAMPFDKPGSLNHSEAYAAVAYILHLNGIVGEKEVLNARTLGKIRMPNRDGFVPDPRPDVKK